ANPGQVLAALRSEQGEVGVKWQVHPRLLLTGALFQIDKPYADDLPGASADALPTRVAGARSARHRGLELTAAGRVGTALSLQASLEALDATYTQAANPAWIGQRVSNLPRLKAALYADYKLSAWPGLSLNTLATYQSAKTASVVPVVEIPAAWQLDAGLSYPSRVAGQSLLWRVQIENLSDRVYWREAPTTDWGGIYLFPSTPRTLHASVTIAF
ncbi:MAG: TonB-dependent receptor domain-containing protein, partial [Rhodoferax sp.]